MYSVINEILFEIENMIGGSISPDDAYTKCEAFVNKLIENRNSHDEKNDFIEICNKYKERIVEARNDNKIKEISDMMDLYISLSDDDKDKKEDTLKQIEKLIEEYLGLDIKGTDESKIDEYKTNINTYKETIKTNKALLEDSEYNEFNRKAEETQNNLSKDKTKEYNETIYNEFYFYYLKLKTKIDDAIKKDSSIKISEIINKITNDYIMPLNEFIDNLEAIKTKLECIDDDLKEKISRIIAQYKSKVYELETIIMPYWIEQKKTPTDSDLNKYKITQDDMDFLNDNRFRESCENTIKEEINSILEDMVDADTSAEDVLNDYNDIITELNRHYKIYKDENYIYETI